MQVAPGVNAQFHQHLFMARIDFSVDDPDGGRELQVSEVNIEACEEGPENLAGNAFAAVETPLLTESAAQRVLNPASGRYFKVANPKSLHPVTGKPVAWKIMMPAGPLLLAKPSSSLAKRAFFAKKNLWVTPHSDAERWPAGDYTVQDSGGQGEVL